MDQEKIREKAQAWTQAPFDERTRQEAEALLAGPEEALNDAFYKDLDFGTGGLRGIMGVGTNRINRYTLGMATQGLANYLQKSFPNQELKVAIAHDSRHNSKAFSRQVAEVFAANGIQAFLFEDLRPTPELSFAVREMNCHSGIMITASHNPPQYNGYKVYWQDGGQLVPPHDQAVIEEVRQVNVADILFAGGTDRIESLGKKMDDAYLRQVQDQCLRNEGKKELKVVFTSIHGTSITLAPRAFAACGFEQFSVVQEQAEPDGDFSTVESPNPEEGAALALAIDQAEREQADLVIGTDPDGDRVGLAVRNHQGKMELINGNQAAAVLIHYLLENKDLSLMNKPYIAKTIVTSDLLSAIAKAHNIPCYECLTGFKWIADIIRKKEGEETFVAGGEESYGYLVGDFVRDKDANVSAVMLAEAAAVAKAEGGSFYDLLIAVYMRYGFYLESLKSLTLAGRSGSAKIEQMMADFRSKTPDRIAGEKVVTVRDYAQAEETDRRSGTKKRLDLPKSNVVQMITEQGSKITARPSGTEPKIKFYVSVNSGLEQKSDYELVRNKLRLHISNIEKELGL